MATKNPRVVGYIQTETHVKLKQYMEQNNLAESKALDLILGEYFGTSTPRVTLTNTLDIDSKIEKAINQAIAPIQKQLDALKAEMKIVAD